MMLEVVINIKRLCFFIAVLGTILLKGFSGRCGLLRDKSTVLLAVINARSCFKYFKLLCEVQQSVAEFTNSHKRPKIK